MKPFISLLFIFLFFSAFSQNDTTAISTIYTDSSYIVAKKTIKGFYLTYDEFKNDNPSIIRNFSTIQKTTSKNKLEKGVYRVDYKLAEGEPRIKQYFWGFYDDSLVYVKQQVGMTKVDYWKLECYDGFAPFFTVKVPNGPAFLVAGLVDPVYETYFIDENGKTHPASTRKLKKFLGVPDNILNELDDINSLNSSDKKRKVLFELNKLMKAKSAVKTE